MMHDLSVEKRQTARTACDASVPAQPIPQRGQNGASWLLVEDVGGGRGGMWLSSRDCVAVDSRLLMSFEADDAPAPIRAVGAVVRVAQAP